MPTKKNGVTTYGGAANGDPAPWETDPNGWNVDRQGGTATKKNVWMDKVLPAVILGGMAAPWAVSGLAGLGGGAAAGGGSAAASSGGGMGAAASGAVGTAGTAGGSMSLAALGRYGIPALGDFLTSLFSTSKDSKENQKQRDFAGQQYALDRASREGMATQQTALDESKLDPWRGTMSQVGDASKLDRLAGSTYTPVSVSRGPGGRVNTTGGATYNKSPELIAAAKAAAQLILSGGGRTPTMTDPANYGQTGTVDLTRGGRGTVAYGRDGQPLNRTRPVPMSDPWNMAA